MAANFFHQRPFTRQVAITNSDTASISPTDSILIKTAGNLALVDERGNANTVTVVAGTILPLRIKQVKATGSTATAAALYYV